VVFALRLKAHAGYLHDVESLLVPTAGRELFHGHAGQFRWFQANVYQGSSLVDAFLSAAGFAMFGDGLWAWKWYGVGYGVAIAAAGAFVLTRLTGRAGGAAFVALMGCAPFVLMDGLLTPAGGHASGFFWALIPFVIAVGGRGPPTLARGIAAGAALAVAAWYTRTAVAAGPALLVVLAPGGLRPLFGAGVGLLAFPLLGFANAVLLTAHDGPLANRGLPLVFREVLGALRVDKVAPVYEEKVLDVLGFTLRPYLFALTGGGQERHHLELMAWAGRTWNLAWVAAAASLGVVSVGLAKPRSRAIGWAAAVLLSLGAGYSLVYMAAPLRIDPLFFRPLADPVAAVAPGVPGPRYLVPVHLAWTLGLAGLAGLAWTSWWTRPAVLAVAWVAAAGAWAGSIDRDHYAEPPEVWADLRPYDYLGFYGVGLGRGPGMYWHTRCGHPDPVSRAAHRRAAGRIWADDARMLTAEPDYVVRRLGEYGERWGALLPEDVPFVVQGIGRALGNARHSQADVDASALIAGLFANAETLGRERGEVLLRGFAEGLPIDSLPPTAQARTRLLCPTTSWGTRPLCTVVGKVHVDTEIGTVSTPEALFGRGFHPALLSPELGPAVVEGAADRLRSAAPATQWAEETLASWDSDLAGAFLAGWRRADARATWAAGDPADPFLVP